MTRLIVTFENVFAVMAAIKALQDQFACRITPTPPGLTSDICGMSIEILDQSELDKVEKFLEQSKIKSTGFHRLEQ
jgi:hypothetical protein